MGNRVAIVTGGARGIGAAISEMLARDGVHVAMGYSANRTAASDLASKLDAEGLSVSVHQGNAVPAFHGECGAAQERA